MAIRRKAFVGPIMYTGPPMSLNFHRDKIRDEAEFYINKIIGPENVVSITEHAMTLGPFSVVVWYHDERTGTKPPAPADDLFD